MRTCKDKKKQENIMKKVSCTNKKSIYEVGEYCPLDGKLWYVLIDDNKNTLKNIKKVILEHYQQELSILTDMYSDDLYLSDDSVAISVIKYIGVFKELMSKIKNADSVGEISSIELKVNYRSIKVVEVDMLL